VRGACTTAADILADPELGLTGEDHLDLVAAVRESLGQVQVKDIPYSRARPGYRRNRHGPR
jgi:hypothetical protein